MIRAVLLGLLLPLAADASDLQVAVASNFRDTMEALAAVFRQQTGQQLVLSFGSTGKHYAQIVNGAPFDAFLAADAARPARLEAEGLAVPGSRRTYALGRLVLWSPSPHLVDAAGAVLGSDRFRHLALANPRLAPYGAAAREVLDALGLLGRLGDRLVLGENVAQAYHFVASGAAELGFVALTQVADAAGSRWLVPEHLHAPIRQDAVLLRDTATGRDLMAFLASATAAQLIAADGYGLP